MAYHSGDEWKVEVDFAGCISEFEYKYIIKDAAGSLTWEWGHNRKFTLDAKGAEIAECAELVDVRDAWREPSDPDTVFLTSAFCDAIFARGKPAGRLPSKKPKAASGSTTTVRLQVAAPRLGSDDLLCVSGSLQALGKWSPAKALPMDDTNFPLWTLDLDLDKNDIPFSYKYVIKDKKGKVIYEEDKYRNAGFGGHVKKKASSHTPKARTSRNSDGEGSGGLLIVTDNKIEYQTRWRGSGMAVPVFSLRTKGSLGVGEFLDLKPLVDWASGCGFRLIQLLPVNDTTVSMMWWDSYPYANVSVFALHPLYLNLQAIGELPAKISEEMAAQQKILNGYDHVKYDEVIGVKMRLARDIFQRSKAALLASDEFRAFFKENRFWLEPYAAFSALRDLYKTSDHHKWQRYSVVTEEDIRSITAPDSTDYDKIAFYYFLQYHLHVQLTVASAYAKSKGVVLKGDIPIGIHKHSDSCWLHPQLFHMDQAAGAPPDPFSDVGQNWGFPTYDWDAMKKDDYSWWRLRLAKMSEYFQMVRLDHVLGFFRIWEIPDRMISGLMGHFNPAIPLGRDELEREGIWDFDRLSDPYVPLWLVRIVFGHSSAEVILSYLEELSPGHYKLKGDFNTQRKIEDNINAPADAAPEAKENIAAIKSGLSFLVSNIVLFRESDQAFHPRINAMDTPSFDCLDVWMKERLIRLYNDYFYRRQDDFWRLQALTKLPVLKSASDMLICGEDLGMVPECVGPVMEDLCILGLRIQRMPKETGAEFGDPAKYPYLTVCTTSSHDMSTIRGWWGEDYPRTQRYWKKILKKRGDAPSACEPETVRQIITQHLESPSMWAVFPVQDILAMSAGLRRPGDPREEQINDPANPHHYWKFRLHINIEKLIDEKDFSAEIQKMVASAGRLTTY